MAISLFLFLALAIVAIGASALEGQVGKLPALGWNSWNAYHCNITEQKFLDAAQMMVSKGLKDAGYEYVNIDDCWSSMSRDNTTSQLVPDFTKFPSGINGTAAQVHALGLKIGIYSSAGNETCEKYPASFGYEDLDAQTWAEWGIDYIKYDNCNIPTNWKDDCNWCLVDEDNHLSFTPGPNGTCPASGGNWCPQGYNWTASKTAERYRRMRDAILKTNRPMLYSLCEWGTANVQTWGNATAQSWRSTGDIQPSWPRILEILNENSFYMNNVKFYGHSDPDMLEVGNGNLTAAETRSHFALWAAMKAPLLIGTDLAVLKDEDLEVLTNKYLLAFNQDDVYGAPAAPYKWGTNPDWTFDKYRPAEFWSGESQAGILVLALNTDNSSAIKEIHFDEVPQLEEGRVYNVRNIWSKENLQCVAGPIVVNVTEHDTLALLFEGESDCDCDCDCQEKNT